MNLSIIVPTIGRPSLYTTLLSILPQLDSDDHVLVVGDGSLPQANAITSSFPPQFRYMESAGPANDWGATPRNFALDRATGTHLAFMDDDDVFLPGAFHEFRKAAAEDPMRPHIFRMIREEHTIWTDPVVRGANVSTQMFLIPNILGKVGRWTTEYDGDFKFLIQTLKYYRDGAKAVVWKKEIVARLLAHRKGLF